MKKITLPLGLSYLLLITPAICSANPSEKPVADSKQPINIQANQLKASEKSGQSVYQGSVEVSQGSLTLSGDKLEVKHPEGNLDLAIITGTPAKFKRFDTRENTWVHGQATTIEYSTKSKTVLLQGKAQIEQPGKQLIKGPKLFYDIEKQSLQAEGSPENNQRISVTFTPTQTEE